MFDVLIVGAGPIGLATGIEAKKAGLSYVIIEKGCLVNSLYNYPVNMTFFSTSERLEIGDVPFVSHNPRPTRQEALEYYRRVQTKWELNVQLFEKVEAVNREEGQEVSYTIQTSKGTYQARSIVVATGFFDFPNYMNIKGEELPKVKHYYDDPHLYAFTNVVVVGAANSSVDAALQTFRKGANVTMIIREQEISHRVKYWVKPDVENRIKEGSITAHFGANIEEIKEGSVIFRKENGEVEEIPNDFVLALTGYQPDFGFLKNIGIDLSDDEKMEPEHSKETYETNMPNIFLAGVICGGMITTTWFIENSREHADIVINQIKERIGKGKNVEISN
ncbi:YpdA family putative bacillithiol disulfide reductase [Limibacter armeniacum]|uniref:YpdA family putative bacillithiol disulfide reductase n=1 Tax=Limibacter armeniacum TaxID=466084 RepID=UPI002FE63420